MSEKHPSVRARVLAEVCRAYEQRVMNNVHRSDYVEAIVAVALADYGWTRKDPWEGLGLRAHVRCPAGGEARSEEHRAGAATALGVTV